MCRAKTEDEIREELLLELRCIADYWAELPGKTPKERCDGVVFSILNLVNGTSNALPAFDLLVVPHEDDKQFHIDNGDDYYEPMKINGCSLHYLYYQPFKNP